MRLPLFIFASFLLLVSACRKAEKNTSSSEPLQLEFMEIPDSAGRTQVLSFRTIRRYPCANYRLRNDYRFADNEIEISFHGVENPGVCLTAFGPATASFRYRDLAPGTYRLRLFTGDGLTQGELRVSGERFEIVLPAESKITAPLPVLNRIPDNTIFGTLNYPDSLTAATAQRFIDSLQNLGARKQRFLPGRYQGFEIGSDGDIVQEGRIGSHYATSFIYRYDGADAALRNFVNDYASRYRDSLFIMVENAKGQRFFWSR